MSNKNIYDIVISEEVARRDTGSSTAPQGGPQLILTMDTSATMPIGAALQNPINVTSSIKNMPLGWEVQPSSHVIEVLTYGNPSLGFTGSNATETYADPTNTTLPPSSAVVVKDYSSTVTIFETGVPTNILVLTSLPLTVTAVAAIYYGFLNTIPVSNSQLSSTISPTFYVASNGVYQDFYISVPAGTEPAAIKDEHGLISDISEYEIQIGAIASYTLYKYKWPIKFVGNYGHAFTLIYS